MKFLWISDPWDTLDLAEDSTLALHEAAGALGHGSLWADVKTLRIEEGRFLLEVSAPKRAKDGKWAPAPARPLDLARFQGSVHYRVDPPVNEAYLHPLRILRAAGARVVNPPELLALGSEKLLPLRTPGKPIRSLVSSDRGRLLAFARRESPIVAKPLHSAQSKGVERWETIQGEAHLERMLSGLSDGFRVPVLLQEFLTAILEEGELRLWFVRGRMLACARKRPLAGDFRVQIDQGSGVEAGTPTAAQRKLIPKLGSLLKKMGVELAAIDLVGTRVLDFNITSPGLLKQMEVATGRPLARETIALLAKR